MFYDATNKWHHAFVNGAVMSMKHSFRFNSRFHVPLKLPYRVPNLVPPVAQIKGLERR